MNVKPHTSIFHYNLSRPYPYRWFTPVVVVGGLAFTALISVLNVGVNGYSLRSTYTYDPNSTWANANSAWFLKPPFTLGGTQLRPQCDPTAINVGTGISTTNRGLRYTVTSISNASASQDHQFAESMMYLNNFLQNCSVDSVGLTFRKLTDAKIPGSWWTWNAGSTASAHCIVATPEGQYRFGLTTTAHLAGNDFSWVMNQDYTNHASIWWGSRLTSLRYMGARQLMAELANGSSSVDVVSASMSWHVNDSDPESDNYFKMGGNLLYGDNRFLNLDRSSQAAITDEYYNKPRQPLSAPITEGLQFAKAARALVEVDLGVTTSRNMLLNDDLLQHELSNPNDFNRQAGGSLNTTTTQDWADYNGINWPGTPQNGSNATLVNETYPLFKNVLGRLETKPAYIFGGYTCTVPVQKDAGTVFIAVLLADLVFLQAIWKLYNFIVGWMVTRADEQALWCPGCLEHATYRPVELDALKRTDHGDPDGHGQSWDILVGNAAPM